MEGGDIDPARKIKEPLLGINRYPVSVCRRGVSTLKQIINGRSREAVDVPDFPAHVTHSQYISHGSGADLIPSVKWIHKVRVTCFSVNLNAGIHVWVCS